MNYTEISYLLHEHSEQVPAELSAVSEREATRAMRFHATFPGYQETPLHRLTALAAKLGVAEVLVKDESFRFGLNAFKSLGGSYAVGRYLAACLGKSIDEVSFAELASPETKEALGTKTFVTATDGNHGRGVAFAAHALGHRAVVYMPKGSAQERLANIRAAGAEAAITDLSYDDAVRLARQKAEENGWVLLQDTAWPGYEEIPRWIMQGYLTLSLEALRQMRAFSAPPTHLFLQAGVGSFAGSVAGFFAEMLGEGRPKIIIVEPTRAACLYETVKAQDGTLHFVTEEMNTMMAGLACGEPCTIGWEILDAVADAFVACPDLVAVRGMRLLGHPLAGDAQIISGESGAVTVGLLAELMERPDCAALRTALELNAQSRVLLISTEGDTDSENYRRILAQRPENPNNET